MTRRIPMGIDWSFASFLGALDLLARVLGYTVILVAGVVTAMVAFGCKFSVRTNLKVKED